MTGPRLSMLADARRVRRADNACSPPDRVGQSEWHLKFHAVFRQALAGNLVVTKQALDEVKRMPDKGARFGLADRGALG
jgi:hypothetical protein